MISRPRQSLNYKYIQSVVFELISSMSLLLFPNTIRWICVSVSVWSVSIRGIVRTGQANESVYWRSLIDDIRSVLTMTKMQVGLFSDWDAIHQSQWIDQIMELHFWVARAELEPIFEWSKIREKKLPVIARNEGHCCWRIFFFFWWVQTVAFQHFKKDKKWIDKI